MRKILSHLWLRWVFDPEEKILCGPFQVKLSGPVLRDTARLSQRCPRIARCGGFLVSQHGQLGAIPPPPFLSVSPLESMRSGGAMPPPQKGYLGDTCAIPYENKANGCDTPLCDTISKGYCAICWAISHRAAKKSKINRRPILGCGWASSPQLDLPPRSPSFCWKTTNIIVVTMWWH